MAHRSAAHWVRGDWVRTLIGLIVMSGLIAQRVGVGGAGRGENTGWCLAHSQLHVPLKDLCTLLSGVNLSPYMATALGTPNAASVVVSGRELGRGGWAKLGWHLTFLHFLSG